MEYVEIGLSDMYFLHPRARQAGHSPLAPVSYSPHLTYPIYLFPHAIAQSIDHICNSVLIRFLLSSILFPISSPLPLYVVVSLHK